MSIHSNSVPYSHGYHANVNFSRMDSPLEEVITVHNDSRRRSLREVSEESTSLAGTIQKVSSTAASYLYNTSKAAFGISAAALLLRLRQSAEEAQCSDASSWSVLSISSIIAISSLAFGILARCVESISKQCDSPEDPEVNDYQASNSRRGSQEYRRGSQEYKRRSLDNRRGSREYEIKRESGRFQPLFRGTTYILPDDQ